MGVSYSTSTVYGVVLTEDEIEKIRDLDKEEEGIYEWLEHTLRDYPGLAFSDAGSYYGEGVEYAVVAEGVGRHSWDMGFKKHKPVTDFVDSAFRETLDRFFRESLGSDEIHEPHWYTGMTVG